MARNHHDDTTPPLMPGRLVRADSRLAAIPVVAFLVLWSGGAFLIARQASRDGFEGLAVIMPIGMGVFGLIVMAVFVVGLLRGGRAVADAMDRGAHRRQASAGPSCAYCGGPLPAGASPCEGCGARSRAQART